MMETTINLRKKNSGEWVRSRRGEPYGVRWRTLRVGDVWGAREGKTRSLVSDLIVPLWRACAGESNLLRDEWEILDESKIRLILSQVPSFAVKILFFDFWKKSTLSQEESIELEQECLRFWRSRKRSLDHPNPHLAEAVTAMNFKETYGICGQSGLEEMPYKKFQIYNLANNIKTRIEIEEFNKSMPKNNTPHI